MRTTCLSETKNVLAYSCCRRRCVSALLPLPPSWPPPPPLCCHRYAATATLPLPAPMPSCRRRQHRALAKLSPPLPSWPLPPRFRHHRRPLCFSRYCRRCHRRHFRVFSRLLIVCAPAIAVAAGVFVATAAARDGSTSLVAADAEGAARAAQLLFAHVLLVAGSRDLST